MNIISIQKNYASFKASVGYKFTTIGKDGEEELNHNSHTSKLFRADYEVSQPSTEQDAFAET